MAEAVLQLGTSAAQPAQTLQEWYLLSIQTSLAGTVQRVYNVWLWLQHVLKAFNKIFKIFVIPVVAQEEPRVHTPLAVHPGTHRLVMWHLPGSITHHCSTSSLRVSLQMPVKMITAINAKLA